jgi:hypothetical protein
MKVAWELYFQAHGEESCESARWLAKQIGNRLPPGWGAVVGQESVRASRRASTGKQDVNNRQARRPRAAHKRRLAVGYTASESDEGEAEGADWDECYGVKMSPANPRYVGKGDST